MNKSVKQAINEMEIEQSRFNARFDESIREKHERFIFLSGVAIGVFISIIIANIINFFVK